MKRLAGSLFLLLSLNGNLMSQPWPAIRQELVSRLQAQGQIVEAFPPICQAPLLPANARYERDTIWVGALQPAYHTFGDSLSLLFHEWQHVLQERKNRFIICLDSLGQVPQWQTDQWYEYQPDSLELAAEFTAAREAFWWEQLDSTLRQAELARLWRDLQQPRRMLFVYAPSRLAEAELEAYRQQLLGETLGLYRLSSSARSSIQRRLRQLRDTLTRRQAYEQKHGLPPDGCGTSD